MGVLCAVDVNFARVAFNYYFFKVKLYAQKKRYEKGRQNILSVEATVSQKAKWRRQLLKNLDSPWKISM